MVYLWVYEHFNLHNRVNSRFHPLCFICTVLLLKFQQLLLFHSVFHSAGFFILLNYDAMSTKTGIFFFIE